MPPIEDLHLCAPWFRIALPSLVAILFHPFSLGNIGGIIRCSWGLEISDADAVVLDFSTCPCIPFDTVSDYVQLRMGYSSLL